MTGLAYVVWFCGVALAVRRAEAGLEVWNASRPAPCILTTACSTMVGMEPEYNTTVEKAAPGALVSWPAPPNVVLYDTIQTSRPTLEGTPAKGRSTQAVVRARQGNVTGVRFVLADGKVDGRTVAVVPGQPCRVVRS